MNYTKADLRKFFIAGRRYGLTENEDNTTMSFDKFFEVYSQIQEDIKEEEKARQKEALVLIMEEDAKNGMYDQHKEQWKGWISMKKIEEMKKRDEDKLNQPDKIKATIKKDSEAAKVVHHMKTEKQAFKETVESGNKIQTSVEYLIEQLQAPCKGIPSNIIEQAKQMHEDEIRHGWIDGYRNHRDVLTLERIEKYYKSRYNDNSR